MTAFQQYRAGRANCTATQRKAAPVSVATPWNTGMPDSYRASLDAFLAQRRSTTPSFISMDKVAMVQNYASAVYLPISFTARQFSRSKVSIYRYSDEGIDGDGKVKVPESVRSLYRLFSLSPNPNDTFNAILYSMSQQYDLCGECYVWMPPTDSRTGGVSETGEPQEFYVIPSAWVSGLPSCPWWQGGAYQVTPYVSQYPGSTQSAFIPANQMLRIYDPHPLYDKTGFSVLQAISQAVDTLRSIDQARASAQLQGCQQNLALELDPSITGTLENVDIKRIRAAFQEINAGARNAGKTMILPPGVKANRIATIPDDMAWQEGWQQLAQAVNANFHTNSAALGLSGDMTYATLFASIKQLYWSNLEPRCEVVAARWNKDYFAEFVGEDYFCELELPPMDDEQLTLQGLDRDLKAGAITVAEYRKKRGYPVDPATMPWVNERIGAAPVAVPVEPGAAAEGEPRDGMQDPDVEANRPRNVLGQGSSGQGSRLQNNLGSRIDESKLFDVMDNALVRGVIQPSRNGHH